MKKISWTILLAVISLTIPVHAQKAAPTVDPSANPLLNMLALIPDNADTRPADGEGISYADYRALEAAQGVPKPSNTWDKDTQSAYFHAMQRVHAGILLNYFLRYLQDSPRVVGFEWASVDQAIQIGIPPRTAMLLAGMFDSDAIGKALKARDFEQTSVDGITVWRRFEDAQLKVSAREPADPFGGDLGMAARIALLPGFIANSRYTDITTQFIAAYNHKQPSLADADDYRTLAAAITDSKTYSGSLLQALFVSASMFEQSKPPQGSKIDPSTYGKLPPYTLGVIADRQEGATQVHLIALYYTDVKSAKQAGVELAKRISGFDISGMYERLNVTIDDPHVYEDSTGKAAAVVSVHYDLPSATPDPNGGLTVQSGLVYSRWIEAIYRRNFTPLDRGQ